ncbi:MAG: prolyl oligopeptidase family serine peptidase [Bacteroidales bacterium]|nr:prolyl oligopeptidase family serine peptidase [Bacteroidales bacterium]
MKKYLSILLLTALCMGASAQIKFEPNPAMPMPENVFMYYNVSAAADYDGRFPYMAPSWLIYPDGAVTREEAEALVDQMGLNDTLKDYVGMMVVVLGPVGGNDYDTKADFSFYETLMNKIRVFTNLKVVGIGKGATFVNQAIAPVASEVADILCIDGKPAKKTEGASTVPAYLAGKQAAKAAKAYIARDKAVLKENGKTLKVYENPEEPLLKVVVNTGAGGLRETVKDAWDRLLSCNYRVSNLGHTSYMGAALGQYGDYELEPFLMWDRIGTVREKVEKSIFSYNNHQDNYLWYEYRPQAMKDASPGTIPLVVLLHGHNNDPRTQAETSGFVELGAEEGFMVAELEWQGKPGYDYMGDHGIEAVIRYLLKTYPQLDASRVYAEGLSAGGFSATALGVSKSHLFAAVGAHSGGIFVESFNLGFPFMNPAALKAEAAQKAGKVRMPFFSICGTVDDAVPFVNPSIPNGSMIDDSWRLYQKLNGLEVSGPTDLEKYPVFGLPLENRHRIETVKHHAMEVGDILDRSGLPVIRIVAVENFGHWNFVPGAREMWNFFKQWRRDPVTGESIYGQDIYIDAAGLSKN